MSDYLYAVTRAHNQESNMLNRADMERLIGVPSLEEAQEILRGKGWDISADADAMLERERTRTWNFLRESVADMRPFEIFQLESDYHNLKVSLKLAFLNENYENASRYLLPGGTMNPELLFESAQRHDFSALPGTMAECTQSAYEALLHTQSGQTADTLMDAGTLAALDCAGRASASALVRAYATLRVDAAMIRIALRAADRGFSRDYLDMALPKAGDLDLEALKKAGQADRNAVLDFLEHTQYRDAAEAGRRATADMERWFDDRVMALFLPQKYVYDGLEPLVAYLVGKLREIEAVRLVLSGKRNRLPGKAVAERLRALYV